MDRGACWATVHGVAKSWTRLSDFTSLHLLIDTQDKSLLFFFFTKSLNLKIHTRKKKVIEKSIKLKVKEFKKRRLKEIREKGKQSHSNDETLQPVALMKQDITDPLDLPV